MTTLALQKASQPEDAFTLPIAVYGDSTTFGAGATELANTVCSKLSTLFSPDRRVINHGIGGEDSTEIANRFLAAPAEQKEWITIINFGRIETGQTSAIYITDLDRCIAAIPHDRYLIATPTNGDYAADYYDASTPGELYDDRIAVRSHILTTYPNNYVDILATLLANGDGSSQDNTDIARQIIPSSLRTDLIHHTDAAQALIATDYQSFITGKGW